MCAWEEWEPGTSLTERQELLPSRHRADRGCSAAEYFIGGKLDVAMVLGMWILISRLGGLDG